MELCSIVATFFPAIANSTPSACMRTKLDSVVRMLRATTILAAATSERL